jgi:hypothetical protein
MARMKLELSDLSEIIHVLGTKAIKPSTLPVEVLELIDLAHFMDATSGNPPSRWQAAIKIALEAESGCLRRFLDGVNDRLLPGPQEELNKAREDAATAYVKRVLFDGHPELNDQVDKLNEARGYGQMRPAAEEVRNVALDARRMLMDPQLGNELALQLGTIDPEHRRFELADLAVNVVTAADYLLYLIDDRSEDSDEGFSAETHLGGGASVTSQPTGKKVDDDLRYRRALDSRAAVVRLGGRLLRALRSETVAPL